LTFLDLGQSKFHALIAIISALHLLPPFRIPCRGYDARYETLALSSENFSSRLIRCRI